MNRKNLLGWSFALCLGAMPLLAQETNQIQQLKQQLRQMQENLERMQREQREQIEALKKQVDALERNQTAVPSSLKPSATKPVAESLGAAPSPAAAPEAKSWSAAQPITVARSGTAYMNIGFDTLMHAGSSTAADPAAELQLGDHDPLQRGFSVRNAEISLDGAVDPYFKGFANIVLKLDQDNETAIELEETYLQSTSLPANLQLKAGQFFAEFGRQNSQHPHSWAFVDQPMILNRMFGGDGLRNVGARLSWLAPTPFYSELMFGVFNGEGGTAFSFRDPDLKGTHGRSALDRSLQGPGDLLFVPRFASSFDLTDTQTLVLGASGAFGPNDTGRHHRTEIYGVDAYWKWKPANSTGGFPFVSCQAEGIYRRLGAGEDPLAGLPAENLTDWGFYTQLLWGFHLRWVAGLRGEFVSGNDGRFDADDVFRGERARISPNLTWYPSEFSKLRLQYNHDEGERFGSEESVWLQLEFMLGAHAAHKF